MKKPNLRKENRNSFVEEKGINILKSILESSQRFKTYFNQNDKTPIFDGYFNYLDENFKILKKIEVQIKACEELKPLSKGPNQGKYKFAFDTAVLNSIKYKITDNSTLYFVVDCKNKRCFYKLIDKPFLIDLHYDDSKKNVSFYFDDGCILKDINFFERFIHGLYLKSKDETNFKSTEEIRAVQLAMDDFYGKLHELEFIQKSLWPDLWKFGIRFSKNVEFSATVSRTGEQLGQKANAYAIYPLTLGKEETGIKDFAHASNNLFETFDLSCEETLSDYLNGCLSRILNFYFDSGLPIEIMPDICLDEIIFAVLDELTKTDKTLLGDTFNTCKYNTLHLDDLRLILNPYLEIRSYIANKNLKAITNEAVFRFFFDPRLNLRNFNLICFADEVLKECERRNKTMFNRVWNYFVDRKTADSARYIEELFDEKKLGASVSQLFDYLISQTDEMIDKLPIKLKNPLCGSYVYEFRLDRRDFCPTYVMDMVLTKKNCRPNFAKGTISNGNIYEWRCVDILFSDLFQSRIPLFCLLRVVMHFAICKKFGLKYDSIVVGNMKIGYPFFSGD